MLVGFNNILEYFAMFFNQALKNYIIALSKFYIFYIKMFYKIKKQNKK